MESPQIPSWKNLSMGGKGWLMCFLVAPPCIATLIMLLPTESRGWAFLVAMLGLLCLALAISYLVIKWTIDFGDAGDLWKLEFFFRRIVASLRFSRGELWLRWARQSKNWRLARAMIEESAQCGNMDALFEWGQTCKIERRDDSAGEAFLGAAAQGHPIAAWEIGEARRFGGYYLSANRAEARRWHEIAARSGYLPSVRVLAVALEAGDTLDHDPDAAKRWRNRLQMLLDQYEQEGSGTSTSEFVGMDSEPPPLVLKKHQTDSFFEAVHFIQSCFEAFASMLLKGFSKHFFSIVFLIFIVALASYVTWTIYNGGVSAMTSFPAILSVVPVVIWILWIFARFFRPDRALVALEKRASRGEPEAMYKLGMLYRNGSHYFSKDVVLAREWLLRAAEVGHMEAALVVGQFLAWGYGGQRDREMARKWFLRAKQAGLSEADTYLQRMGMEG